MKHIILLFLILPMILTAQSVDMERMNRDLKVAENGLQSLISQSNAQDPYFNVLMISGRRLSAQYIKEYGVVFEGQFCEPCLRNNKNKEGQDFTQEDAENFIIEQSKTFLADYAGIIGQLKDDQKIMIKYTSPFGGEFLTAQGKNVIAINRNARVNRQGLNLVYGGGRTLGAKGGAEGGEIKIESYVSDIKNHFQGSLGRDAFMQKVKVDKVTISNEVDPQLETFVAMFHRLYQQDLSSTYYMSSRPRYSKISDVGTKFSARVYSSNTGGGGKFAMPTIQKEDLTLEQRNAEVQKMLPKFEKEFKENIINYARTIRSENENQAIIFDVRLTQCEGCPQFPTYIKFSVSQDVLNQFNKGKLSFDQAVTKVEVERRSA